MPRNDANGNVATENWLNLAWICQSKQFPAKQGVEPGAASPLASLAGNRRDTAVEERRCNAICVSDLAVERGRQPPLYFALNALTREQYALPTIQASRDWCEPASRGAELTRRAVGRKPDRAGVRYRADEWTDVGL